jgi:20S proteasome alpha/beta subunit
MKDKEFKDMTLDDLLASNLTLEDIDDIIEEQLKEVKDKSNDMVSKDTNEVWSIDKGKWICLD